MTQPLPQLSDDDRNLVAELRNRFERQWGDTEAVTIESILSSHPDRLREALLVELIPVEVSKRSATGEQILPAEFFARFSDDREAVRRMFATTPAEEVTVIGPNEQTPADITDSIRSAQVESTVIKGKGERPKPQSVPHDARFAPPEEAGEIGRFGQYRILQRLGGGGMGDVFLGEDTILGRKVALKLMRREFTLTPEFNARFFREARAMAALDGPYVIPILQFGEELGIPYLCMPYLQGMTLAHYIRTQPPMPQDAVIKLGIQLCDGLQSIHDAGIVHRDIKPSNIWVVPGLHGDPEDRCFRTIRILDFGLVRIADRSQTLTGSDDMLGTVNYMSPEQASAGFVDHRSDLFSLGIVLYEVAARSHPFERNSPMQTLQALGNAQPRAPHFLAPDLSSTFSALIMRLLNKKPEERPQSAERVGKELRVIRDRLFEQETKRPRTMLFPDGIPGERDAEAGEEEESSRRRFDPLSLASGAGIAILLCAIYLIWFQPKAPNNVPPNAAVTSAPSSVAAVPTEPLVTARDPLERDVSDVNTTNTNDASSKITTGLLNAVPPESTPGPPPVAEDLLAETLTGQSPFPIDNNSFAAKEPGIVIDIEDHSSAVPNDPDEWITPLPSALTDVAVAEEGNLLVLRLAGRDSLYVYNVVTGALIKELRQPSPEFIFAAGGESLLLYFPEFQELHLWDLKQFKLIRVRDMSSRPTLTRIIMASARSDVAYLRLSENTTPTSHSGLYPIRLPDLALAEPNEGKGYRSHCTSYRDFVHYRANANLSTLTEWATSHSPSGVTILMHHWDHSLTYANQHTTKGFVRPAVDGLVYSAEGTIYNSRLIDPQKRLYDLPLAGERDDRAWIPAIGSSLVIGLDERGEMELFQAGRFTELVSLGEFPGWSSPPKGEKEQYFRAPKRLMAEYSGKETLLFDKRVIFLPYNDLLVLLPDSNDRIVRRKVNLEQKLANSGNPYLLTITPPKLIARSGEKWSLVLKTLTDADSVRYAVTKGPENVGIDESGVLEWSVPRTVRGPQDITIRLTNSDSRQAIERLILEVVESFPSRKSR